MSLILANKNSRKYLMKKNKLTSSSGRYSDRIHPTDHKRICHSVLFIEPRLSASNAPQEKKQANNLAEVPNSINHNFLIPDAFSDNLIALGLRCFPVIKKNLNVFSLVVNDLTEVCDKQKRDDTGKERNDDVGARD